MVASVAMLMLFTAHALATETVNEAGDTCDAAEMSLKQMVEGDIVSFLSEDYAQYHAARVQFGFETYPHLYQPAIIVQPKTEQDIIETVKVAKQFGYKIVIRSGGHQYSGLSSCNSNTDGKCIQINLNTEPFKQLKITHNDQDWFGEFEYVVTSGPGVQLDGFYKTLDKQEIFIGGGMCETVHIGGHSQSSGHGFMERAFGTLMDYVIQFTIVLSNGTVHDIIKPDTEKWRSHNGRERLHKLNDDIFWAVLGGGPGSWGVVTEYVYYANKNADHQHSFLWTCMWDYDEIIMRSMLDSLAEFYDQQQDVKDYNYTMALVFGREENELFAAVNVLEHMKKFFIHPWDSIFKKDKDVSQTYIQYVGIYLDPDNTRVPVLHNNPMFDFVRKTSKIELPLLCLPHKQSMSSMLVHLAQNTSFQPQTRITQYASEYASKEFYSDLVDQVKHFFNDKEFHKRYNIDYVSQLAYGDSATKNPYIYADVHRHMKVVFLSTVLFFDREPEHDGAEQLVNTWCNETWSRWLEPGSSSAFGDGSDIRSVAFTHSDVDLKRVWKNYYFDQESFAKLIDIKQKIDPIDLFSNKFTVPVTTVGLEGWQ